MKLARVVRSTAWLLLASATACADDAGPSPQDTDTDTSGGTSMSTGPGLTDASGSGDTTRAPGSEASTATTGDGGSTGDATVDDTTGGPSVVVDDPIRVVYLADDATVGTDELWLRDEADYDAGPLRISHMLPAEAFISPFFPVSADGRWLVYRMIQPGPGSQHELWAVDVSIAAPEGAFRVDDSAALVHEYAITPDSAAIAWIDAAGVHTSSLRAASPGPIVTHTPPPTGEGTYGLFELAADGDTIAYTADPTGSGAENAFVLSLSTQDVVQLSDLDAPGTAVDGNSLGFSEDGVVYQADRDVPEPELFWAARSGGEPVKINVPVVDESIRTERLAPGGGAIAWWMGYPGAPDDGSVWVAGLPSTGPTAALDVHAGEPGTPQQGRIMWSADASALLYSVFFVDRLEGWLVEIDAGVPGVPVRITGDVLADGELLVAHAFDRAGNVFYVAGTEAGDELFFVDRSSGEPAAGVRISPTPAGSGLTGDLRFAPGGATLAFTGFVDSTTERDLYRVDLSAAFPWPVERVETSLPDGGEVTPGPTFSADGAHLVYTQSTADGMERHLLDVPPGGRGFDEVLPLSGGGHVTAYTLLP